MSILSTLRELFRTQSAKDSIDANSDPSVTLVDNYINMAVREIILTDRPKEYYTIEPVQTNIFRTNNYLVKPSDILVVDKVLIYDENNKLKELKKLTYSKMVDLFGLNNIYDFDNSGTPDYFCEVNTNLLLNKYPSYNYVSGALLFGIETPTIMNDPDFGTLLPIEYDLLIIYTALTYFYQKENEDNGELLKKFIELRDMERAKFAFQSEPLSNDSMYFDNKIYKSSGLNSSYSNPYIFFGQ